MGGLPRKQPTSRSGLTRLETHIPGLDVILEGGLLRGGLYLFTGEPGTGKTVMANHLCFAHAARGGRSLYVTLIAESHARMLANMSSLGFFDASAVRSSISYLSGYHALREQGLDGLLHLIEQEIQRHGATVLALDGIDVAVESAGSMLDFRGFLNRLRALLELTGCTAVLCAATTRGCDDPVSIMADGVFALSTRSVGARIIRLFDVHKFRGSVHLEGPHVFNIDERGVSLHPRTEVLLGREMRVPGKTLERASLGVERLDQMLSGGVMGGSATAVVGAPGSGKTLLGLHFLVEGARRGQPGLYFGFYESPARIIEQAEGVGLPLSKYRQEGKLAVMWSLPHDILIDSLAERIFEHTRAHGTRRLFIDGLEGLLYRSVFPERVPAVLAAIVNELRAAGVTTLLSVQSDILSRDIGLPDPVSALVENTILLRYVELRSRLRRFVSIIKVRGSGYDPSIREFHIDDHGIAVASPFDSAEAILGGLGRVVEPADSESPHEGEDG